MARFLPLTKTLVCIALSAMPFIATAQQTLTSINGWNAYVHLPDDYNTTGTKLYPLILFLPGTGEVGTNAGSLLTYGPSNFINSGWNGQATVNGQVVKPIIISLQPPAVWPSMSDIDQRLTTIKNTYRVDPARVSLTGLSMGGWASELYVEQGNPYAAKIASICAIQAVKPDDNPAYPAPFAIFAQDCGHWLGYEQVNDFRDMQTIANTMNAAVPGSAVYFQTDVGGGGHCCWNTWYDPTHTDNYSINGVNGNYNIYQFMLSYSGCSASSTPPPATSTPPSVNAGPAQTITLQSSGTTLQASVSGTPQQAYFNLSNAAVAIAGWTNLHGSPNTSVLSATDPSGISISSVSTANWNSYNGACSYNGNGSPTAGFFANTNVTVNNWYNYGDPAANYNSSKPQFQLSGLNTSSTYTIKLSGSNIFPFDTDPTAYTITGASTYSPISISTVNTGNNGATFTNITPDAGGHVNIFVNTVSGQSVAAMINGIQVTANTTTSTTSGTASATLTGTATGTNGATIKSTTWKEASGPSASISSPSSLSTAVSGMTAGTYVFTLTATDNNGLSASSNVTITVNNSSTSTTSSAPIVYAGPNQTITLPTSSVQLKGTVTPAPGTTLNATGWSKTSGGPATITSNSLTTTVTGLTAGTYVFTLMANDTQGDKATSNVTITVLPAPSGTTTTTAAGPTVNAGAAQTITLPTSSAQLKGTVTPAANTQITNTGWSQAGGSPATIASNSLTTTVSGMTTAGTYVFTLTAWDNAGNKTSSNVTITVNASAGVTTTTSPTAPSQTSTTTSSGSCGCDVTLSPPTTDGQLYIDGTTLGLKPGNKVCLKSAHYVSVYLYNFYGAPGSPITIVNCGGPVTISGYKSYGFILSHSWYVHITGAGDPNTQYGIQIDGGPASTSYGYSENGHVRDIEVDHMEVKNIAGVGMGCAPTPTCDSTTWSTSWKMYNISFHDNYVHHTQGEGYYIGNTQYDYNYSCSFGNVDVHPQQIDSVKFYNNRIDSAGWTAAQISQVTGGVDIHDNLVTNYGYLNAQQHQAGIIIGEFSQGRMYNNKIIGGTGDALQYFGNGMTTVYNNIFANAGYDGTAQGQPAVFVDDRVQATGYPALHLNFINNTIVNPARNGVSFYNDNGTVDQGNILANNLIVAPGILSSLPNVAYFDLQANPHVTLTNNVTLPTVALALFANPSGNDYHLNAGSPGVDAGMNAASYGVTTDLDGNQRPIGKAYDAGAYEYNGTTTAATGLQSLSATGASLDNPSDMTTQSLSEFPNPAHDVIHINWADNTMGSVLITLYDNSGRAVQSSVVQKTGQLYSGQLSVATLAPGVYYLTIKESNGQTQTKKVIKQ